MRLIPFLQKLSNETVQIELKSNSVVTGTIKGVDNVMNVHLKSVKVVDKNKAPQHLEHMTVRGNNIRHIILPDTLNLENLLVDDVKHTEPKGFPTKRART